jgi:citrate lyase subunit beta / citryl-CoA lyase
MIRSLLFLPGNAPKMLEKGPFLGADTLIFDLEDAVSPDEKDAARILLKHTLSTTDFGNARKVVRINSIDENDFWKLDLEALIPTRPYAVLLPKAENVEDVQKVSLYIQKLEEKNGIVPGATGMILLLETCLAIEHAYDLAVADKRVCGLLLGAEDLTADMQAIRTLESNEIMYARMKVVTAARAAKIDAYDTPFTDMKEEEKFEQDVTKARKFGFTGKASINPRHVAEINRLFLPTKKEIEYAHAVLDAITEGKASGRGAVALNGKMIDRPVVLRAERIIEAEKEFGGELLNE